MMQTVKSKNKIQNVLTLKHSYQYYIKDIDKESSNYVDYKLYKSICTDFNKLLIESLVEDGKSFQVPYRLGILRIRKRKIDLNNLRPNFGLFNKTGIKTVHLNEHSGGFYGKYHWNKTSSIVKNKTIYSFIPTRANLRYLSKVIKEGGKPQVNKYFE